MTLPEVDFLARLDRIEAVDLDTTDLTDLEPLLGDLLDYIQAHPSDEAFFKAELIRRWDQSWEPVLPVLTFCMHTLRWPEVRQHLESVLTATEPTRPGQRLLVEQDHARWALKAFDDDWDSGYDRYRSGEHHSRLERLRRRFWWFPFILVVLATGCSAQADREDERSFDAGMRKQEGTRTVHAWVERDIPLDRFPYPDEAAKAKTPRGVDAWLVKVDYQGYLGAVCAYIWRDKRSERHVRWDDGCRDWEYE